MDVNNLTVIITLINLIIFIAIPIGIVVFIIKVVKNQKKMKSDIELLNKRLSELENKQFANNFNLLRFKGMSDGHPFILYLFQHYFKTKPYN